MDWGTGEFILLLLYLDLYVLGAPFVHLLSAIPNKFQGGAPLYLAFVQFDLKSLCWLLLNAHCCRIDYTDVF